MTKGCISQITTKEQVRDNFKIANLASFPIRLKHSHDLFCFALVVCAHPYCACNTRCNVTPLSRHHGKKINNNGANPGGGGTSFYYIDKSVLLENTPLVKFIRTFIRDSGGVFSISSLVKISMISLISILSLLLKL